MPLEAFLSKGADLVGNRWPSTAPNSKTANSSGQLTTESSWQRFGPSVTSSPCWRAARLRCTRTNSASSRLWPKRPTRKRHVKRINSRKSQNTRRICGTSRASQMWWPTPFPAHLRRQYPPWTRLLLLHLRHRTQLQRRFRRRHQSWLWEMSSTPSDRWASI